MLLTFSCANSIAIVGNSSDLIVRVMLCISPSQLGLVCSHVQDHLFEISVPTEIVVLFSAAFQTILKT